MTGGWLADTAAMYAPRLPPRRPADRGAAGRWRCWRSATRRCSRRCRRCSGDSASWAAWCSTAAAAACFSSWLFFLEQIVRGRGRVDLRELPASFGAYLGDLLNVGFLLFLLQLVAAFVLAPFPLLLIVFGLAVFAFLNAVPELVYLGRSGAAELLAESYRFIAANWIEWFPANLAARRRGAGGRHGPAGRPARVDQRRRRRAGRGLRLGGTRAALPRADDVEPARARVSPARGGVGAPLPVLGFEPALGVDRRHAAGAGGGDRLAVGRVLHVAARRTRPGRWCTCVRGSVTM